ncbi:hypothetical protein ZIOFF_008312 [Zingiber officinale]|uniref:Uncharacterized protein n=1 Tax=Zingiber officinale TaxID=94328 RepID=A0A8J5I654_ZINOF|nr:hypothetical protein ZIOFF_008312 [Zingiber officinale]
MAFISCGFIVFLCATLLAYDLSVARGIGKEENVLNLSLDSNFFFRKLHVSKEDGELDTKKRTNSVVSTYTDDQMSKRRVRGGSDPIHNRNTEVKELP